jgi:hypothetical protein
MATKVLASGQASVLISFCTVPKEAHNTALFPDVEGRHPELIKGDWVKPGAVVVDVGINVAPLSTPRSPQCLERPGSSSLPSNMEQPGPSTADNTSAWSRPSLPFQHYAGQGADLSAVMAPGTYQVVGDVAFEDVCKVWKCWVDQGHGIDGFVVFSVNMQESEVLC